MRPELSSVISACSCKILLLAVLLLACPAAVRAQGPFEERRLPDYLSGEEARTVKLYQQVLPAVVTVIASKGAALSQDSDQQVIGSGVLISPDCHILTAAHVVRHASQIQVRTVDGQVRPAGLIFSEPSADIALIQFDQPDRELAHAVLGNSNRLAVGQQAYAIGAPYGLENSYSVGHISGFRKFDRLYDGAVLAEYIQTDAAINIGNSGGPLFNSQGEVIGIASKLVSSSGGSEGVGLVVSINTIKQLLTMQSRVWLGFEGVYLNREGLSSLFNLDQDGGLLIERVAQGGPAAKAGLRGGTTPANIQGRDFLLGGDLILSFELEPTCGGVCLFEAHNLLAGRNRIPVTYLRGGKQLETVIDVTEVRRNFLRGAGGQ